MKQKQSLARLLGHSNLYEWDYWLKHKFTEDVLYIQICKVHFLQIVTISSVQSTTTKLIWMCSICRETQKIGHVTFNWNGNQSKKIHDRLETYQEIHSENVKFDVEPEMRAATIANVALDALLSGHYDYVRVMFANGDMVGHTRDFEATKRACVAVDEGIKARFITFFKWESLFSFSFPKNNIGDHGCL